MPDSSGQKVKDAALLRESRQEFISLSETTESLPIRRNVYEPWPVRRQTYGYLLSR